VAFQQVQKQGYAIGSVYSDEETQCLLPDLSARGGCFVWKRRTFGSLGLPIHMGMNNDTAHCRCSPVRR